MHSLGRSDPFLPGDELVAGPLGRMDKNGLVFVMNQVLPSRASTYREREGHGLGVASAGPVRGALPLIPQ